MKQLNAWSLLIGLVLLQGPMREAMGADTSAPAQPTPTPKPAVEDEKRESARNWVEVRFTNAQGKEITLWCRHEDCYSKPYEVVKKKDIPLYELTPVGKIGDEKEKGFFGTGLWNYNYKTQSFSRKQSAYTAHWGSGRPAGGGTQIVGLIVTKTGAKLGMPARTDASHAPTGEMLPKSSRIPSGDTYAAKHGFDSVYVAPQSGKENLTISALDNLMESFPACRDLKGAYDDGKKGLTGEEKTNRRLLPIELELLGAGPALGTADDKKFQGKYAAAVSHDDGGAKTSAQKDILKLRADLRDKADAEIKSANKADSFSDLEKHLLFCDARTKNHLVKEAQAVDDKERPKLIAKWRSKARAMLSDYVKASAVLDGDILPPNKTLAAVGAKDTSAMGTTGEKIATASGSDVSTGDGTKTAGGSGRKSKEGSSIEQLQATHSAGSKGGEKFDGSDPGSGDKSGVDATGNSEKTSGAADNSPLDPEQKFPSRDVPNLGKDVDYGAGEQSVPAKPAPGKSNIVTVAEAGAAGGLFGALSGVVWSYIASAGAPGTMSLLGVTAGAGLMTAGIGALVVGAVCALIAWRKS